MQSTKKKNRKEIKEIAKNSKEMFDYLLHICDILIDHRSNSGDEEEINGFKRDLIKTLKKLDSNNSKIFGRIAWEGVKDEEFSTTFKLDQYNDYNAYIKENSNKS
jgi:hypothetical protein